MRYHIPNLKVGRRVCITAGPFEGLEGILIHKKNELRFVISLDLIQGSVSVDGNAADVELPAERPTRIHGQ